MGARGGFVADGVGLWWMGHGRGGHLMVVGGPQSYEAWMGPGRQVEGRKLPRVGLPWEAGCSHTEVDLSGLWAEIKEGVLMLSPLQRPLPGTPTHLAKTLQAWHLLLGAPPQPRAGVGVAGWRLEPWLWGPMGIGGQLLWIPL